MNLLFGFRLGVTALACLGALALGSGQGQSRWILAAIPVCLASLYLCDAKRYLVLGTAVANVLGIVAMFSILWNFGQLDQDLQLVALARLLVALQCILFYRPKTRRLYWMLILLSLMEFQVASIVHESLLFGGLIVLYLGVGAAVLCMFHLIRCRQEAGWMSQKFWPDPEPQAPGSSPPPERPAQPNNWSVLRGTALHLFWLGLGSLATAPLVFLVMPRHNQNPVSWRPPRSSLGVPVTGFGSQVRLGEIGRIVQNSQEVARVRFVDTATGKPYELSEPPLLQGVTLWSYRQGSWSAPGLSPDRSRQLSQLRESLTGAVLAQLHLEPVINSTVIFSPHPAYLAPGNKERILYDPLREVLFRRVEDSDREFQCLLLTTAFRRGKLRRFVPARPLSPWQKQHLVQFPGGKNSLAGLKRVAFQVTETFDAGDWVGRARALEAFLKDSGRFSYTLLPPARSPGIDPIEDFLLRHRAGHCEYFASALVLMLRACGIPARLVVGFKPSEYNTVGGYYVVRQQDAHTWVQAYIPREKLPRETAAEFPPDVPGGWLLLDPTPAGDEEQLADTFDWNSLLAYVRMVWNQYIVRMDARRQRNLLMELFFYWEFTPRGERLRPTRFFLVLLGLVLGGLLFLLVRRWNLIGRLAPAKRAARSRRNRPPLTPFYRRMERVLARHLQLRRAASQTPREFAQLAARELRRRFPQNGLADVPRRVVDCYYQVRFGNRSLSEQETRHLEELVLRLDHALQNGNGSA